MKTEKILMSEVATLYYKKNMTQQEIAETLHLSRQTVSKLLSDAIGEKIAKNWKNRFVQPLALGNALYAASAAEMSRCIGS